MESKLRGNSVVMKNTAGIMNRFIVPAVFFMAMRGNGHRTCTNVHLTTADQRGGLKAYLVPVAMHMRRGCRKIIKSDD